MLTRRLLQLPATGTETFFLWGPRQAGKTTLLRQSYPDARWVDLLKSDEFRRYSVNPEFLRQEIEADGPDPARQVVIDEVQKVPALLDEVHWLMENRGLSFGLCGSSARKVRRGAANLLGGRAVRLELRGLTAGELGDDFDLPRMLNHGYLPRIYEASRPTRLLDAYVADYLREEVAAEGLVRNLPAFSGFLDAAALSDGEAVNVSNVARECGVSSPTAKSYFGILEDTLLGRWLPAYRRRRKRRLTAAPKFYFADVGVVNRLARRGEVVPGSELYGKAVRELGPPRAVRVRRLPRGRRRAVVLAPPKRHRGRLRARRRAACGRREGERQDRPQPPEGPARHRPGVSRDRPPRRRVPRAPVPANGRRDRHPAG